MTFYLLFAIELRTRRVHFAGFTPNPDKPWMKQIAKNLTDCEDGSLLGERYLLMDWDAKCCSEFCGIVDDAGVKPLRLPPRSPNLSPHLERFIRSVKEECLDRLIHFGEKSLRNAVIQCVDHHDLHERNHQGLGNKIIEPDEQAGKATGHIRCHNYYSP